MNEFYIRNVLEAALLAAGKPLQLAELSQLFDETARPKSEDIRAALDALTAEYSNRGVEVKETAAGFRIQVRREFSAEVSRLWPERPVRYSRALLETLALIAYRQPITRAEIEAVRGVAVNPNIIKTVIERNWVRVVGHRDVPGRPELLGTTREFLDYFGLRSLDELPPLADIKALGEYNPQLELPGSNGAAALAGPPGEALEGGADGAEVAVVGIAVAGLLTSDSSTSDGTSSDANGAGDEGADVESAGLTNTVAEEGAAAVDAPETTGAVAMTEAVATEGPEGSALSEVGAPELAASEVTDSGVTDSEVTGSDVTMSDGSTEHAPQEVAAEVSSSGEAIAREEHEESEAEAERTLAAGEGSTQHATPHGQPERSHSSGEGADQHVTADSDDGEGQSTDSLDAMDDSSDEEADEDELSADGHASRELVAGPRNLDD